MNRPGGHVAQGAECPGYAGRARRPHVGRLAARHSSRDVVWVSIRVGTDCIVQHELDLDAPPALIWQSADGGVLSGREIFGGGFLVWV